MAKILTTNHPVMGDSLRLPTAPCRMDEVPAEDINSAIDLCGNDHGIASRQIEGIATNGLSWFVINLDSFGPAEEANIQLLKEEMGESPDFTLVMSDEAARRGARHGYAVLVNPIVAPHGQKFRAKEGCTSIIGPNGKPKLHKVKRRKSVSLTMRGVHLALNVILTGGIIVQTFQHEADHLRGRLIDGQPSR